MTLGDYLRPLGVRDGAGRQDAHARRPRGHGAARHRSQLHHRRARRRMRLRPLRARRRPARASAPTGATIRKSRATTAISTTRATPATTPGTTGPTPRRARATSSPPAGPCAMRGKPARVRRGGLRDALHDAAAPWISWPRPATRPGACTSPTSSRTGPTSRPRPTTTCSAPPTCCPSCAREEERQRPASDLRRVHGPAREPDVRARRGARGGHPRLHGTHQADRRSAGPCCSASWSSAACSRPP